MYTVAKKQAHFMVCLFVCMMVLNATFNNISVICRLSGLLLGLALLEILNRIGCVMVNVLASSVADRGFES
jgi:hypothetical protein